MRLFVALEVPEDWRAAAHMATEVIARSTLVPLRRVDPALMHLTLRFLGEVDPERLVDLCEALARRVPPVGLTRELGAANTFGRPDRANAVWLGVSGDVPGLRALARRVERAVRDAGLPPEDRTLQPHLTLARLGAAATPEQRRTVAETAAMLPPLPAAPFRVREVVLVQSTLGGAQPRYEVLARIVDVPTAQG